MNDLAKWYTKFFFPFTIGDPKTSLNQLPTQALSIKPPWSHLFFYPGEGAKDIENRNWRGKPKFRGPVFVHASSSFDSDGYTKVKTMFPSLRLPDKYAFQQGGIIGMFTVVDVVSTHPSPWYEKGQETALVIANPIPLPFFQCKGMLNFWDASEAAAHYKRILQ